MNDTNSDNGPRKSYISQANDLRKRFPIIFNLLLMAVAGLLIIWALLYFLSGWTHHGEVAKVPDVKGLNLHIAKGELHKLGFETELADSIYDNKAMPGTVVEQSPHPDSNVKPGRTVYLTIVAYTPKTMPVPDVVNTSVRQGQSMLEGAGFKKIQILRVPSEYQDLVLAMKYNGRDLRPGTKLPVTSLITLEVGIGGDSNEPEEFDNLTDDATTADE